MDDTNTYYGELFPIKDTICKDCVHRISRIIVPLDPDTFGLDEEILDDMGIGENEDVIIEQHTCLISQQDMDYLVKECTQFRDKNDGALFKNNPYV